MLFRSFPSHDIQPDDFVDFARLNVAYNVPLSDLKVDSSLYFELRFPELVPVGTSSSNLNVKSNLGFRLAHAYTNYHLSI